MEKQGIMSKILQGIPTTWLSSLVFAKKANNNLCICLDPRDLNAYLQRTNHRAPTVEEITHKLSSRNFMQRMATGA